ncbi:MAG: hypothetical protein HOZ81_27665 [Streptomyces sp.]|nr:hypothetical protein [Streptomyces sp.]
MVQSTGMIWVVEVIPLPTAAVADDHTAAVGDVLQVQAQHFTGPQPALEHEQHDRRATG